MTGPRRRPPAAATAFAIPALDDELAAMAHPSTMRLATVTPIDEPRPTPRKPTPRTPAVFVQIPLEILLDSRLSMTARVVWGWLAAQPELWNGTRAAVNLHDCTLLRDPKEIRKAIKGLAAVGHVKVYPRPGQTSEYSLPWLAIHRVVQTMKETT